MQVIDMEIFFFVFVVQVCFWIFLSLTRVGKAISAIWGCMTLIGFILSWYPTYLEAWKAGFSGNVPVIGDLVAGFIANSVSFLIQLVIPPWVGLLTGIFANKKVYHGGVTI